MFLPAIEAMKKAKFFDDFYFKYQKKGKRMSTRRGLVTKREEMARDKG